MGINDIRNKISIFERITSLNLRHNSIKEEEIYPRVFLINSSSYDKTVQYLKSREKSIFLNFEEQKENFYNEIRFKNKLSLEECISFANIINFWLNLSEESTIVIRFGKRDILGLYMTCFLISHRDLQLEEAEKTVNKSLLLRKTMSGSFLSLYEAFLKKNEFKSLDLHQIVISTIPRKRADSEKPFMKPFYSVRIVEKPIIPNVQHDENHIICKLDVTIRSDVLIEVYRNNSRLFTVFLNTIGYDEGLYRFTEKDCMVEDGTVLSPDFSIDIIFFTRNDRTRYLNFDPKAQISDIFAATINKKSYKYFKQLGLSHEDAIISILTEDLNVFDTLPEIEEETSENNEIQEIKDDLTRPYEPNDSLELEDLEIIHEYIPEKKEEKVKKRKLAPARKPKVEPEQKKEDSVVVRPFYWAAIPKSCDSIFNELQDDVSSYIDCTKFEEWFCVTSQTQNVQIEKQTGSVIKDTRRLFLVSIALKTFEKKELELSVDSLRKMSLDDLQIVHKILPSDGEFTLLDTNKQICNEIERKMIKFYKYVDLVKVLIFERKFFEVKDKWFDSIKKIKLGFDEILQSNNIRILLKLVLEVGNLINTNYGNNRKAALAFKLNSLILMKNYKGKGKNQSLLKFVAESAKTRLRGLQKEIDELKYLEKEDFTSYKDAINEYITEYKDLKELIPSLDDTSRAEMKAFFYYFTDYVLKFKTEYRETVLFSSIIKRKFGEPEDKKINEILGTLFQFLKLLQDEMFNISE